jgi:cytosine/creatinine deaminase
MHLQTHSCFLIMFDILVRRGRVAIDRHQVMTTDLAIQSGKIVQIGPDLSGEAHQVIDAAGCYVSPPFVESHIHLDSALTAGNPRWNQSGTLFEGIEIWREFKQGLNLEDVKTRAIAALQQQAAHGVLYVRSHADVSEQNLIALQALLEVREAVKDWMTLQVVAFPQDGIYGSPHNEDLMEEALRRGADVVGGIPHYEMTREDGVRSVHRIFELAQQYDRRIDIHCDEIDDDQSRFLEVVAACAVRSGMESRVTASHTTAMGSYNNAYAFKLMGLLGRSKINFVSNPLINITLQGRMDSYPKRRGLTRVKELWQAGLNVSLGHDCIQDPWYSLGTGNLLDVAAMAVHVGQMTGLDELQACYEMVTWNGARTLGIEDYGIRVGGSANFVVLEVEDPIEAIRTRSSVQWVVSRGRVIVKGVPRSVEWLG